MFENRCLPWPRFGGLHARVGYWSLLVFLDGPPGWRRRSEPRTQKKTMDSFSPGCGPMSGRSNHCRRLRVVLTPNRLTCASGLLLGGPSPRRVFRPTKPLHNSGSSLLRSASSQATASGRRHAGSSGRRCPANPTKKMPMPRRGPTKGACENGKGIRALQVPTGCHSL